MVKVDLKGIAKVTAGAAPTTMLGVAAHAYAANPDRPNS